MELVKTSYEYIRGLMELIKKKWKSFVILFLFAFGILLGAYILKQNIEFTNTTLSSIINSYISSKKEQSIAFNFINSLKLNLFFILTTFLLGFCAVGTPFITLVPIIKGIGTGLICGYLYLEYNFNGLGYCTLIIYPGLIIFMLTLIAACNLSMSFSYEMLSCIAGNNKRNTQGEYSLKLFFIRYAIVLTLSILSSAIDSVTIRLFSGLFNF